MGCLNLDAQIAELGAPMCLPVPSSAGERKLSFTGLYDLCLALSAGRKVVGNDFNADEKSLFMITGANTGGKSTFLRSIGLAQLMMQAGMMAAAEFSPLRSVTGFLAITNARKIRRWRAASGMRSSAG